MREQRVLDLWKEHCGNYSTFESFCSAFGPVHDFSYSWLRNRRNTSPEFARAMDDIAINFSRSSAKNTSHSNAPALALERWPHLDAWKGVWLEVFRVEKDREAANNAVRRTFAEVEVALRNDPSFSAGYEQVFAEFVAIAEDSAMRQAMSGRGNTAVLETQSERFSKTKMRRGLAAGESSMQFTDYDVKATRDRAKELARQYGIAPRVETSDVAEPPRPQLAPS